MAYAIGVILFALGILVSIGLHEAGHMFTAKAFGMKVSRFFIGFGPTLFSFRRGETEYGLKPIPAGAFVKIDGMTPLEEDEEVAPADRDRVFWRKPVWQRTLVLAGGVMTQLVLAFVLFWVTTSFVGAPNPKYVNYDPIEHAAAVGQVSDCIKVHYDPKDPAGEHCTSSDPVSPAKAAGLRKGDVITSIGGNDTPTYGDLVSVTQKLDPGATKLTYTRHGTKHTTTIKLISSQRPVGGTQDSPKMGMVTVMGVAASGPPAGVSKTVTYGPVRGVPEAGALYWDTLGGMGHAVARIPSKIPNLVESLTGAQRSANTPISVVGASRLGGQTVELHAWWFFLMLLAQLNLFIGLFNLVPLLPLDGGHVAIAWYEKARGWWAARRGRPEPGRVDYLRLMPITYVVVIVFGGLSVLTVAADIINPISLN